MLEHLCPLCNGMVEIQNRCSKCGSIMKDRGRIQDFYDDYSPYLSYAITDTLDDEPDSICQHIFSCTICGNDYVDNINKVFM